MLVWCNSTFLGPKFTFVVTSLLKYAIPSKAEVFLSKSVTVLLVSYMGISVHSKQKEN